MIKSVSVSVSAVIVYARMRTLSAPLADNMHPDQNDQQNNEQQQYR